MGVMHPDLVMRNMIPVVMAGVLGIYGLIGAGMAIGIVGDSGTRANAQEKQLFVGMILILIFGEALGLYGLIVAIVLSQLKSDCE